jgi:hypothetical protein
LIQALFLQVITWSVIRWAISHKSINLLKSLFIFNRDSVTFDKDSNSIFNKDSDSRFLYLFKNTSYNSADKITNKFSEAQTQSWSIVSLIQMLKSLICSADR